MNLDKLISNVHDARCRFRLSDDEVKDIEDIVVDFVQTSLPKMIILTSHRQYSILEIIPAGSYFEQTKIKLPDEFDFMIVVKELSDEQAISVEHGCKPGYAKVGVEHPERWVSRSDSDGPVKQFELAVLQFNAYLRNTIELLGKEPFVGRYGQLKLDKIVVRGKPYKAFSHVQTASFNWTRNSDTQARILYERQVTKGIEINVDFMTCCYQPLSVFTDVLPEYALSNRLLYKNGCHIVLKPCGTDKCIENGSECRLISYTKTEQQCMRNLHRNWKVVYKSLKWLFGYTEILGIDSYKLKTAVLRCSRGRESNAVSVGQGFLEILNCLRTSNSTKSLPGFFNPCLNVWNISPCYHYLVKYEITFLLKVFKIIHDTNPNDFNIDEFQKIIDAWHFAFCKYAVDISNIERDTGFGSSRMEIFNIQGNIFLEIVKEMEPSLKTKKLFSWIPLQMKCMVLLDVFKNLFLSLTDKIANLIKRK